MGPYLIIPRKYPENVQNILHHGSIGSVARTLCEVGVDLGVRDGLGDDVSHRRAHRAEAMEQGDVLLPVSRRQAVCVQHV